MNRRTAKLERDAAREMLAEASDAAQQLGITHRPLLVTDVALLKQQKRILVALQAKKTTTAKEKEAIEGVLNLLDAVHDDAEPCGE